MLKNAKNRKKVYWQNFEEAKAKFFAILRKI